MDNSLPQLAALALFAEINARIDAGESRIAVLTEKGLSEVEFQQEQERWLSLMATQAQQHQWQLQQRYSALYAQWRLKDNSEHTPPMPFVIAPLAASPMTSPLSEALDSPAAAPPAFTDFAGHDYIRPPEAPAHAAVAPIRSPAPSAFGSPFPLASGSSSPPQRVEPYLSTTPPFTSSSANYHSVETNVTGSPNTAPSNVARAPLFVSGLTASPVQEASAYTPPASYAAPHREVARMHFSPSDAQPVHRAPTSPTQSAASGVILSFEQLTCLTAELQVKPEHSATTFAGYGIDEASYQAQHRDLLMRCEADDHLSQRYQRLLEYYRSIVSQR